MRGNLSAAPPTGARDRAVGGRLHSVNRRSIIRIAVAALAALLFAACIESTADDATGSASTGSPSSSAPAGDPALGDLTRVTGTVEVAELTGGLTASVPMPITLEVGSRGSGNGGIVNGVVVGGTPSSIVWDGGRPAVIEGDGTIAVQPGRFDVRDAVLVADMGDAAHELSEGEYVFVGPAAVGSDGGLARPSDRTPFRAEPGASFSGTGQVRGTLPAGSYEILGPGRLVLTGRFEVQTAEGTSTATSLLMEQGDFELTVHTSGDITTVEALIDGPVTAR